MSAEEATARYLYLELEGTESNVEIHFVRAKANAQSVLSPAFTVTLEVPQPTTRSPSFESKALASIV